MANEAVSVAVFQQARGQMPFSYQIIDINVMQLLAGGRKLEAAIARSAADVALIYAKYLYLRQAFRSR